VVAEIEKAALAAAFSLLDDYRAQRKRSYFLRFAAFFAVFFFVAFFLVAFFFAAAIANLQIGG
jgi:hypothetical protein